MLAFTLLFAVLFTSGFIGRKPHERAGAARRTVTVHKFGAGRGSDTEGAGARNTRPTSRGLYRGHTAAYWAAFGRHRTRQLQNALRIIHARPSVAEAINLSAAIYGNGPTLWRKARCESHLNPSAHNGSEASGLFQFLPSTWRTTPFARFSIYSAYANALAAGWMHAQGRGGEWVCR